MTTKKDSRQFNIDVDLRTALEFDQAAGRAGATRVETARRAFRLFLYLERVVREGGRIKVVDADGTSNPREIVLLS